MTSNNELSLLDKGIGISGCVDALQSFVKENGCRPSSLTLTKNHAIGVDGLITLAETWLATTTKTETDEGNSIKTLNVASCSLGRETNPATGANILTARAMSSLGIHGDRIVNLDLSWNDLNSEAIESLVRGLLDIKGPGFEAESYNPATLIPSRTCALESLKLKGNSILDQGVKWLSRLIYDPTSTLKTSPSNLKYLDLYQCAIEENGAEVLCECLTSISCKLTSLDLRENDVKSWNRALAEAAIKSSSLVEFCGISFTELNQKIAKVYAGEVVTLVVGKDAMCHGTLALLLSLRPFFFPEASCENPLAHKAEQGSSTPIISQEVKATGSIVLDLRGSAMCGFYWEEVEAVDALIELLEACVGVNSQGSITPEVAKGAAEEVQKTGASALIISAVELDTDCGLTGKQTQNVYDACMPPPPATAKDMVTKIKINGAAYTPAWACSIM